MAFRTLRSHPPTSDRPPRRSAASHLVTAGLLTIAVGLASTARADTPVYGDLVISELMIAPATGAKEWIELYNVSAVELDLLDCVLTESGTGENTFEESVILQPGEHLAMVKVSDKDSFCMAYADEKLSKCILETEAFYSGVTLNNSEDEVILSCDGQLVDSVAYNWDDYESACWLDDEKNCSINLCPGYEDPKSNDDPGNWEVPVDAGTYYDSAGVEALATPAAVNSCMTPISACTAGDAFFSELMAAPPDGYKEWIELFGTSATECNLSSCSILIGPYDDHSLEPGKDDKWSWTEVEIAGENDRLSIISGQHLLLARSSDWITGLGKGKGKDDIPSDYSSSSISLSNSDEKWLHLVCGSELVDSAPLYWPQFSDYCPQSNCSVNLAPANYNGTDNDELTSWCLPPDEPTYTNPAGEEIRATPGEEGECLFKNWPTADDSGGEMVITEVIASPQGGAPEFIELMSLSQESRELTYCTLQKHRLDENGDIDEDSITTYLLGEDGRELELEAGAVQLLTYKTCLYASDTGTSDTASEGSSSCDAGEFSYSTIQISADVEEHISLICPDENWNEVEIDSISFNFDVLGVRDGHSLMLDPGAATTADNDDLDNWCHAAFSQKIEDLSDDVEDCNYGTPGELGDCLVDQPETLRPVCRCGSAAAPRAWWAPALLGLLALMGIRRRGA